MSEQDIPNYDFFSIWYFDQLEPRQRKLIFEFFFVFSRFEYALKMSSKYCSSFDKTYNYAKPNWDLFITDYNAINFNSSDNEMLTAAFSFYLHNPPRFQIYQNGVLSWSENERKNEETDFSWVIRSIKIVRNNLFHGGKFPFNLSRDEKLLFYGLILLNTIKELDDQVNSFF